MNERQGEDVVKKRAQVLLVQRGFIVIGSLILMLILGLLVFDAVTAYTARKELLNCTTPPGECYEEGQKNTAKAIVSGSALLHVDTRRVVILTTICQERLHTKDESELTTCVNRMLQKEE
jgi:hypothetical protein